MERVAEKAVPSLCRVVPVGVRNTSAQGTGFVVRREGDFLDIVTCAHVAMPGYRINVTFESTNATFGATVLERSRKSDVALLRVETTDDIAVANFRDTAPKLGEFAVAFGYAGSRLATGPRLSLGVVSSVSKNAILVDNRGAPGMSGGPLLDAEGLVIGTLAMVDEAGYSVYVPVERCQELLENKTQDKVHQYRLMLYNDPFNKKQRVQDLLIKAAGLNDTAAMSAMAAAHTTGQGLILSFTDEAPANDLCLKLRAQDLLVDVLPVYDDDDNDVMASSSSSSS